jgi:hypothetical protein
VIKNRLFPGLPIQHKIISAVKQSKGRSRFAFSLFCVKIKKLSDERKSGKASFRPDILAADASSRSDNA